MRVIATSGGLFKPDHDTKPIRSEEFDQLHPTMQNVVHYRKSGLSLNHVVGCPLECAYCIRHSVGAYDLKQARTIMSDEEAVEQLVSSKYFRRDTTPLQLFNKATDPFLPSVKPHTFRTIRLLDELGLKNDLLVITRYKVSDRDCETLNDTKSIRLTVLVTYSGIDDKMIEPISNRIPAESLKTLHGHAENYRVILYWRPLVPGINDSDAHILNATQLANHAHATAFTGLFYREEMRQYFTDIGMPHLSRQIARRKILPQELERKVLESWVEFGGSEAIFRKTSCAVSYAHGKPDYNGHFGIQELCDICPTHQYDLCRKSHCRSSENDVRELLTEIRMEDKTRFAIGPNSIKTVGLDEPPRYFLQHALRFQIHDERYPHKSRRHGRADIGWPS
ncbi:MAG: radical SAM protein [Gammaproteobacteria bacterium]|nr:radical SAM protein [Gammaproteobacteria bacterium]